jgi:lysyl-tRNA synthetase class 2
MEEHEIRLQKLKDMRAAGVDPYPGGKLDFIPTAEAVNIFNTQGEGPIVTVAGRVVLMRLMGKLAFFTIQDWTGRIQIAVQKDASGEETFNLLKKFVDMGDIVLCGGKLFKTRTGEITVQVQPGQLKILTKSLAPLPEKWHGLKDPEIRYRRRYLDLISNPKSLETFIKRSKALILMRKFLDGRGYVEVETPMMHSIPGGASARPFITHHNALNMDLYMRIALEIPLKKLMVGGIEKVYEIGRVFRNEGIDTRHNPEFTMIELYHAYGDLSTMMELTETLIGHLAKELTGSTKIPFGEQTLDVTPPWPRHDYMQLLKQHTGADPTDLNAMKQKLRERGQDPEGRSKIDIIDEVFGEYVEPHLQSAAFVTGQPIEMTPLCREYRDRPGYADRFEAYIAGMEVANAYNELNDPLIQRERLVQQAGGAGDEMMKSGKIDEDFLLSLEHGMPPAGGLGIGIDRIVMLLTNQTSIREVILFPLLKEEGNQTATQAAT